MQVQSTLHGKAVEGDRTNEYTAQRLGDILKSAVTLSAKGFTCSGIISSSSLSIVGKYNLNVHLSQSVLEVPLNLLGYVVLLGQVNIGATLDDFLTMLTLIAVLMISNTPEEVNRCSRLGIDNVLHDGVTSLCVLVQLGDVELLKLLVEKRLEGSLSFGLRKRRIVSSPPICKCGLSSTNQFQSVSIQNLVLGISSNSSSVCTSQSLGYGDTCVVCNINERSVSEE